MLSTRLWGHFKISSSLTWVFALDLASQIPCGVCQSNYHISFSRFTPEEDFWPARFPTACVNLNVYFLLACYRVVSSPASYTWSPCLESQCWNRYHIWLFFVVVSAARSEWEYWPFIDRLLIFSLTYFSQFIFHNYPNIVRFENFVVEMFCRNFSSRQLETELCFRYPVERLGEC
jgi:hypothetical protein